MATYTDNYNLIKPDYNDDADINDLNINFDVLDTQIKSISDSAATATAELAEIIDGGAKNKLNISKSSVKAINTSGTWSGDTYTRTDNNNNISITINNDMSFTVNGTTATRVQFNLSNTGLEGFQNYVLSCGNVASDTISVLFQEVGGSYTTIGQDFGTGVELGNYDSSKSYSLSINISANTVANNIIIKPMICAKSAWDISNKYVPYCPSLAEIYQMLTT